MWELFKYFWPATLGNDCTTPPIKGHLSGPKERKNKEVSYRKRPIEVSHDKKKINTIN